MGQPGCSNVQSSMSESITHEKVTRRTETSKYPEEEKETSILQVAASERGRVQTWIYPGVADHPKDDVCIEELPGKVSDTE